MREQTTTSRKGQAGAVPADVQRSLGYLKNSGSTYRDLDMRRGAVWLYLEAAHRLHLIKALETLEEVYMYDPPKEGHAHEQTHLTYGARQLCDLLRQHHHTPSATESFLENHESYSLIEALEAWEQHYVYRKHRDAVEPIELEVVAPARAFLDSLRRYRNTALALGVRDQLRLSRS
jgi:hypothetical protein